MIEKSIVYLLQEDYIHIIYIYNVNPGLIINPYDVRPPLDSVQLVNITPVSLWFMVLITIVTGAYKAYKLTSYNYSYWGFC